MTDSQTTAIEHEWTEGKLFGRYEVSLTMDFSTFDQALGARPVTTPRRQARARDTTPPQSQALCLSRPTGPRYGP